MAGSDKKVGTFSTRDAQRVGKAALWVESLPKISERENYGGGPRLPSQIGQGLQPPFWARLTGSTPIMGTYRRWLYGWMESARGAGGWADVDGGRASTDGSGGTPDTRALNSIEANNAATGIQGNGVDVANLVGTFDLVPIGVGAIVLMWEETDNAGNLFYSFQAVNQVDGGCS